MLLFTAAAWAGVCGEEPVADLERAMLSVFEAWEHVDEAEFDRATLRLDAALACLDEPPAPSTLARIHQAQALVSFVSGRTRATRRSLAAARLVDPAWRLDEDLFPVGHPYRNLWSEATNPGPVQEIGRIPGHEWIVDGYAREEAPTERAFLLQVRERGGGITWTGYLWTYDEIPDRGQNVHIDPRVTPRRLSVSILAVGGALFARQHADVAVGWSEHRAAHPTAGLAARVRYTPSSTLGAEIGAVATTPDNALSGQGTSPELQAAVVLGSAFSLGKQQLHAGARLGGGTDTIRGWPDGPDGPVHVAWSVVGPSLGVEAGVRTKKAELLVASDLLLALGTRAGEGDAVTQPYQLRSRAEVARRILRDLAVQGGVALQHAGMPYVDGDAARIGRRVDVDLRITAGIAVWR